MLCHEREKESKLKDVSDLDT